MDSYFSDFSRPQDKIIEMPFYMAVMRYINGMSSTIREIRLRLHDRENFQAFMTADGLSTKTFATTDLTITSRPLLLGKIALIADPIFCLSSVKPGVVVPVLL